MTSILLFFSAYLTFGHASSRLTRVFQTFQFLLGDPEVFLGFSTRFWVYPRVCSLLGVPRKSLGGIRTRCPNHFIWLLLTCRSSSSTPRSLQISELLVSNIILKCKLFLSQIVLPFRVKQIMKQDLLRIMATFWLTTCFVSIFGEALINLKSTSELCSRFTISLKHPGIMKWNHRRVFLKVSLKELSGCWRTFLAVPSVSKEKWRLTWFCQGLFTSNKHGEYEDIWLIKLKCVPHLMTPSGLLSCKLANLWFFFSLCSMLNHCTLIKRTALSCGSRLK